MGLETILLATMAAGTAVSAFGQVRAGQQAKKAAGMEAAEIERRGVEEARIFRRRARLAIGEQVAGFTKGGVSAGTGSPLAVLMESADEMERALAEIHRGSSAEAELARFTGRQAQRAGFIRGAGTILGGATEFGLTARKFTKTGRPEGAVTVPRDSPLRLF